MKRPEHAPRNDKAAAGSMAVSRISMREGEPTISKAVTHTELDADRQLHRPIRPSGVTSPKQGYLKSVPALPQAEY